MKKILVILTMFLCVNLFGDEVKVYNTNNGDKLEYYVVAVAVKYNDIDNITRKGELIIQDDHGGFYAYNPGPTNFYTAVAYGYTGIDQSKLEYLNIDNMQELIEILRREEAYVLPLNEALEIIENNKKGGK